MKNLQSVVAQEVVDSMNHHNFHTQELLRLYPDLTVVVDGTTVDYYSISINSEVNEFQFDRGSLAAYVYMYSVHPYKNVRINCLKCEGVLRINSTPSKISLFIDQEIVYNKKYALYGLLYEEQFKLNGFNGSVLAASQLHIMSKLEEHSKDKHKIDIQNLNHSIKKLLPFT